MGALGLCLVLLTAAADPSAPEASPPNPSAADPSEGLAAAVPPPPTPAAAEGPFLIDLGAKLESMVGTQLGGSFDQNTVTTNFVLEPGLLIQQRSPTGKLTLSYVPWLLYTPTDPHNVLVFHRVIVEAQ